MDFPYYICRVSHFYHMDYFTVLDLPLKVFGTYNSNVTRIRAEEHLDLLYVYASANAGGDAFKKMIETLKEQNESPMVIERGMDPDAFEKLKALQ